MLRKVIKIAEGKNRAVYLDQDNSNDIMDILKADEKLEKKFMERVELIIRSLTNREVYEKLSSFNTIWEIRLFKQSKGRNHRIYCKQIEGEDRIVHVIIIYFYLQKKSNKIPREIIGRLKEIDKYEYDL